MAGAFIPTVERRRQWSAEEKLRILSEALVPVERLWLYLKPRFLSHRLLDDYGAIEDAICNAWQRLLADTGRLASLTSYPWIVGCVST